MTETIVVFIIAGVAFALSARWFFRTLAGKSEGCGCGESSCATVESGDSIKDVDCCK